MLFFADICYLKISCVKSMHYIQDFARVRYTGTCLACLFAADLQVSSLTRICPNSASLRSGQIQEKTTVKEIVPRFSYCKAKPWQLFCFRSHYKNLAECRRAAPEFAKFVPSDPLNKYLHWTGQLPAIFFLRCCCF